MSPAVRPMRDADLTAVRALERRAGEAFRAVGLPDVADDEAPTEGVLRRYAERGGAWVAADGQGEPAGYVLVDMLDGCAHIEQVSVDPDRQGQGLGRALLERVVAWATANGHPAVTLTTFADVPWNRPLYEHLGFRVLGEPEIGPELRALRTAEAAHGLDPGERVCMRLDLGVP